jgi:hypothetical protein
MMRGSLTLLHEDTHCHRGVINSNDRIAKVPYILLLQADKLVKIVVAGDDLSILFLISKVGTMASYEYASRVQIIKHQKDHTIKVIKFNFREISSVGSYVVAGV